MLKTKRQSFAMIHFLQTTVFSDSEIISEDQFPFLCVSGHPYREQSSVCLVLYIKEIHRSKPSLACWYVTEKSPGLKVCSQNFSVSLETFLLGKLFRFRLIVLAFYIMLQFTSRPYYISALSRGLVHCFWSFDWLPTDNLTEPWNWLDAAGGWDRRNSITRITHSE